MSSENNDENNVPGSIFSNSARIPVFRRRNKPKNNEMEDNNVNVQTAAHLRVQRDFADLDLSSNITINRKEDEWLVFSIKICPESGHWKGGIYEFSFNISTKYPYESPKVVCEDKIYHPNIDLEGKICLNILRPWKPTYSIQTIIFGLAFLFTNPNANDPLNNEAAADMRNNEEQFGRNVKQSLNGLNIGEVRFPKNRGFD